MNADDQLTLGEQRKATFYLTELARWDHDYRLGGKDALTALKAFDLDWEQVRDTRQKAASNLHIMDAARICEAMARTGGWIRRLRQTPQERFAWSRDALRATRKWNWTKERLVHLGNVADSYADMGLLKRAVRILTPLIERLKAERAIRNVTTASLTLATAKAQLGKTDEAIDLLRKTVKKARQAGFTDIELSALCNLATVLFRQGQQRRAVIIWEAALVRAQQQKNTSRQASILAELGQAFADADELQKARELLHQGRELAQSIHDVREETTLLGRLTDLAIKTQNYNDAENLLEETAAVAHISGNPWLPGLVQRQLAELYLRRTDHEKAQACLERAINLFAGTDMLRARIGALLRLIDVYLLRQRTDAAQQSILRCRNELTNAPTTPQTIENRIALAQRMMRMNLAEEAITLAKESCDLAHGIAEPEQEVLALEQLGAIFGKLNRFNDAANTFRQALTIAEPSMKHPTRRLCYNLAVALRHLEQLDQATIRRPGAEPRSEHGGADL